MQDDAIHLPITTGSAVVIYGWTLDQIVLILWATYVLVLITIKLPELTSAVQRIRQCVAGRWAKFRGRDESEN